MEIGMTESWILPVILIFLFLLADLLFLKFIVPRQTIKELEKYQNVLLSRQLEEIRNTYREMRGWRHDYKNHMQSLKIYVEKREWENALNYIDQMDEDLSEVDHVIKTGNIMADAIVNSKVSLAKTRKIRLDVTAKIPEKLPVSDVEFCVLFGNLMDNAIEACEKIGAEEERFIRVYIGLFKKQFYLSVTNATNERVRLKKYVSLKGEGHGLGLYRIDKIIKERRGYLNRKNEPGVFATEVMFPSESGLEKF